MTDITKLLEEALEDCCRALCAKAPEYKQAHEALAAIAEFCRVNGITAPVNAVNSPKAQEEQP